MFIQKNKIYVFELEYILNTTVDEVEDRGQLYKILNKIPSCKTGVELGTWEGASAIQILNHSQYIEAYYMIDPYIHLSDWNMPFNKDNDTMQKVFETAQRRINQTRHGNRGIFIRKRSQEAYKMFVDQYFDYIFIDGDHSFQGIIADFFNWYPKIKQNGLICGHDYVDTSMFEVKRVVDAFVRGKKLNLHLYKDKVWCFIKPKE